MIEIGRRGFFTGLAALVAAPAVIRVAPLMKISTRLTPLYVPIDWLADAIIDMGNRVERIELEKHAWSRPLGDNWINLRDYDPDFVRQWTGKGELTSPEYWLS
jgi:hypothetical protein